MKKFITGILISGISIYGIDRACQHIKEHRVITREVEEIYRAGSGILDMRIYYKELDSIEDRLK